VEYTLDRIKELPESAGIYAIVNRTNGHRYVGQAINIRKRIATHVRDLDAGKEQTNNAMLLQRAWSESGRNFFVVSILENVANNQSETHYQVRPDNLNLAEHYYINERAEYNADSRIVRSEFAHLIESKAWREPIDDETRIKLLNVKRRPYLVGRRVSFAPAAVVMAFNHEDAKTEATNRSEIIAALGRNLSTDRLSGDGISRALAKGAVDLRSDV
jgi:group I intron endonuclease